MVCPLEGYGTDRVGRSGLTGKVKNHTASRFGSAALVSVIGALPAALEAAASDSEDDSARRHLSRSLRQHRPECFGRCAMIAAQARSARKMPPNSQVSGSW
ncbi:TrbI/VirB10 family protein [Paracoccus mutanolyticus]|nr:TrbI/VirB10 family protein [Paracoccus mutanolyticus]